MKTTKKPAYLLSKLFIAVLTGFLLFSINPRALAAVNVEIDGQLLVSQAKTKVASGILYVAVEELFEELGGIAYYSPIMKKVHLRLEKQIWTVSLDKSTVVSGEKELPFSEKDIFIEGNTAYVSFNLLSRLFSITLRSSEDRTQIKESPSPQPTETPYRTPSLSGIRYHSYENEARTRVTLDFSGNLPSYSYQIDRTRNKLDVVLRNCDTQNVSPILSINDKRVNRIETRKEADRVLITVFFTQTVGIKDGKLPGGTNPRLYFDFVSLVEAETKPFVTAVPTPSPAPSITPQETPFKTTPTPKSSTLDRLNPKAIVIDPGHGGQDPGCVQNGYQEKAIVLSVAKRLKELLEKEGFQVFMTRSDDTYPTLEARYALVNKIVPLVFISIHCNAAPNPSASGIEVFVGNSKPKGESALEVANRENERFLAEKERDQNRNVFDAVLASAYYGSSREASLKLGSMLIERVTARTGQVKRGTKEAPLVVLRNIYSPAVLVEIGFLSNPKEAKNLASSTFQSKIAQGIAEAIKAFSQSEAAKKLLEE
ncbi:MAG: N-acetylmuramoyl-L-alanine amidase [Atribacterota bacterium]